MFAPNLRYGEMPVKVWIDEDGGKSLPSWGVDTMSTVESALANWEDASGGLLRFERVQTKEDAQIIVNFTGLDATNLEHLGHGGCTWHDTGLFNLSRSSYAMISLQHSPCIVEDTATHELGHALGFDHSADSNDIMYPYAVCGQVIGESTKKTLKELYSIKALPDFYIVSATVQRNRMYFDAELKLANRGLSDGGNVTIIIEDASDGSTLYDVVSPPLPPSYYRTISFANILLPRSTEVNIVIDPNNTVQELSEDNNVVVAALG